MTLLEEDSPRPESSFSYADHADGIADVHLPPRGSGPLLLLLHGGFWKQAYDRRHTRPMAAALAGRGFVVVTPEYRRVGGGGGWPQTGADVRLALTHALARFGAESAVVTGHSAGGHLALWLAAVEPARVRGAVPLAPVCDLVAAARLGLGDQAVQRLLGSTPPADADPMTLLTERAGITLVHGTRDDIVPIGLSRVFRQRHPYVDLVEVDADHFEVIDPAATAFTAVERALAEWL